MATVPTTNAFGEVSAYSAVPVDVPDYTRDMMVGLRQKQAMEDAAIRDAAKQARIRQEKLNKYKNDLGRWVLTQEKGIWQGRTPEMKAMAEDVFQTMMKNRRALPNSYDPDTDSELFTKIQEFQRATDEWQQEKKYMDEGMRLALDPKKRETFNINEEFLDAVGKGDPELLRKSLAKNIYGDEGRASEINVYSGVGFLNPIDTTDWHAQTVRAAKSLNVPIREVDLGGGKYRKTQQLTPEEKEQAYQQWATGAGAKMRKSMIAQAQAANPFFPEEKADEILRPLFINNIEDDVTLKGGGGAGGYGEKITEKMFFSPYTSKDYGAGAKGFNVGFMGSNKGLKANLDFGKEGLKDVDFKTVFVAPDNKLRAIVMQYEYEQRPMTTDERKEEAASAAAQMREPVYTKTIRKETPREIDFGVGSNNYNTIIEQYPGVGDKINELMSSPSGKSDQKAPKAGFDYSRAGMEKKAKELNITVDELKKRILAKRPNATFE